MAKEIKYYRTGLDTFILCTLVQPLQNHRKLRNIICIMFLKIYKIQISCQINIAYVKLINKDKHNIVSGNKTRASLDNYSVVQAEWSGRTKHTRLTLCTGSVLY